MCVLFSSYESSLVTYKVAFDVFLSSVLKCNILLHTVNNTTKWYNFVKHHVAFSLVKILLNRTIFLTHFRHLWHSNNVWSICKFWCIVVDILYFDNKFRFRLEWLVCPSINSLGMKHIVCLLLSI